MLSSPRPRGAQKKNLPAAEPARTTDPEDEDAALALFENLTGGGRGSLLQVAAKVALPRPSDDRVRDGDLLFAAGKYKDALAAYLEARALDGRIDLLGKIGLCYARRGLTGEARKYLRAALRYDPSNKEIRMALAALPAAPLPAVPQPSEP